MCQLTHFTFFTSLFFTFLGKRIALSESLMFAVAAYDTLVASSPPSSSSVEDSIDSNVSESYRNNATLFAALAEFAYLDDQECERRATLRDGGEKQMSTFKRRGSTIALQAAGLL